MNAQNGQNETERAEEKKPEIRVMVSSDGLEASIHFKPAFPDQTVTLEEISAALKENGIAYGVLEDVIRDYCENRKYFLDPVCARGLMPEDEENGSLEYLFQKEKNVMPAEREDGTVDYRDLGIVQNVKKGDVLCRLIRPQPGKDGIDVYGRPVPYHRGKLPNFPQGKNTAVSEDGMTLTAAADGCIEYRNANLNVSETFTVRGDVDSSSGNIDFLGTVIVRGDVLEGFSVKAGGDINVRGMVEGALLQSGGSIAIACGMNGMGHGKLIAGGSISAQYIENASVECQGDVRADVILNSSLQAGNSILARGRKGLLAGGRCQAGLQIQANTIGSGGARTEVRIFSKVLEDLLTGKEEESPESVRAELEKEQENKKTLDSQMETIAQFLKKEPLSLKAQKLFRSAQFQRKQSEAKIQSLKTKIDTMEKSKPKGSTPFDFKIVALRILYAGTKVTIGNFVETMSTDYNATKFYADREHIVSTPIQPVDRV